MEGANQKSFDVFVRNYDDHKPMITLTVTGQTTIGKLKKLFSEQCKLRQLNSIPRIISRIMMFPVLICLCF